MIKETWNYTWIEYFWKLFSEADMSYNSTAFWMVLPVFLGIYLLLRNNTSRRIWVLIGSGIFYIWSGVAALVIVLGTSVVIYAATRRIDKVYAHYDAEKEGLSPKEQAQLFVTYKKKVSKFLWIALGVILGLWVFVKAGKLVSYSTVETFAEVFSGAGIIVPLGISYYTLSSVGYLMDVYWRKTKAERNFINLISAMIYFPHIMQGPISKYQNLMIQMKNLPGADYTRVCYGLQLMLWGYIKKLVIADRLLLYTSSVFASPKDFAGVEILIAVFLCTIQLYADFSGCIDIVRGISQVIGIELENNFRQPFFAKSAQEFWARWHITLGTWTKDYIYLPIAMNPKFMKRIRTMKKDGKPWVSSFLKAFCPLVTVWIFTGLWHGTGIDYLAWGLYWCMIMTLSKELAPIAGKVVTKLGINTQAGYYKIWMSIRTVMFFAVGRMFTVTGSLAGCLTLWKQLFSEFRAWTLFDGSLYTYGLNQKNFYVALVGILVMFWVDRTHEKGIGIRETITAQPLAFRWFLYYSAILTVVVLGMYGAGYDAASFVYGAF